MTCGECVLNLSLIDRKKGLDRMYGVNLFDREVSTFNKRPYRIGMHGKSKRRKRSLYAETLEQIQRLRFRYGITRKQFVKYFKEARKQNNVGLTMIRLLETRLDALVYSMKWAPTIFAAKQLVSHRHIQINGNTIDINSYHVKPEDVISLKTTSRDIPLINMSLQAKREVPSYVQMGGNNYSGTLIKLPDSIDEVLYTWKVDIVALIEFFAHRV